MVHLYHIGNIIIGETATGQTISTYRLRSSRSSTDSHDAGFVGTTIVGWTNNLDFTQERATIVFNDSLGNVDIVTGNGESTLYDWRFDNTGTLTLRLTVGAASNQIKYGLGNLIAWNDSGWVIGEYNGTSTGTEGIRINPYIEACLYIILYHFNALILTVEVLLNNLR